MSVAAYTFALRFLPPNRTLSRCRCRPASRPWGRASFATTRWHGTRKATGFLAAPLNLMESSMPTVTTSTR